MNHRIQVNVEHISNQTVVINLAGDVTNIAETPLKSAYQQVTENNIDNIILNFDDNHYIDSLGLAILIRVIGEAYKQQQHLSVTLASQHTQKIFRLLGIDHYANIFNSLDEAIHHIETNLPN